MVSRLSIFDNLKIRTFKFLDKLFFYFKELFFSWLRTFFYLSLGHNDNKMYKGFYRRWCNTGYDR